MTGTRSQAAANAEPGRDIVARVLAFLRFLRSNGFQVGLDEELDALRLAAAADLLDARRLRWGLRALVCGNARDWERFDELFDAFWRRPNRRATTRSAGMTRRSVLAPGGEGNGGGATPDADGAGPGGAGDAAPDGTRAGASDRESLARSDFRFLTEPGAMQTVEELVERIARRMRRRLVRRMRVTPTGRRIHMRRTVRRSLRYGGLPFDLIHRRRRRELPRLLLLLDVSRSMSLYSYLLLRFARGLVGAFRDAEAFVFHTRLVHVTEALRERDLHRVREKLAVLSLGWSGGTRIGESLRAFNRDYAGRLVDSRTVVVVMSDGFDTGAPALLGDELARLRARARCVIWLNPLLGREGYEPAAGGMQAALPVVDQFLPAHNLQSLQALEHRLARL